MSGNKNVAKNLIFVFASEGIGGVLSFLILLMCARLLGVEGFGVFSFVLAITSVCQLVADFGLTNLIVREVAKDKSKAAYIMSNVLTLAWCLSAVIFAAVASISYFMLAGYEQWVCATVMAIAVLATYHSVVYSSVCRAFEKMGYNAFCFVAHKLVLIALVWWFGGSQSPFESQLIGMSVAYLFANLLQYLFFFVVVSSRFVRFQLGSDWRFAIALLKSAVPIGASMVIRRLTLQVDVLILTVMVGTASVGVFNAAYKVVQVIDMIPFAICLPLFPALSRLAANEPDKLPRFFQHCMQGFLILAIPICGYLFVSANYFIAWFYGSEFAGAATILQVLSLTILGLFINMLLSYVFVALNHQRFYLLAALGCLMVNTLVDLCLIPFVGVVGAAYGTLCGELFYSGIAIYFLSRCNLTFHWLIHAWRPVVLTFTCASVSFFIVPNDLYSQLLFTVIYGTLYVFGLFALRVFSLTQLNDVFALLRSRQGMVAPVQEAKPQ